MSEMDPTAVFDSLAAISIGTISLATILSAVLVLIICLIVSKIIGGIVSKALDKSKLEGALKSFIKSAVKVGLWILTAVIVADSLGIPSASLVAILGVAGLALSLSIQNILSNLFSGLTILSTHPFAAGEFVELGGVSGTVRSVGLFHTVILTVDNKVIYIPNSDVTASKILNYSHEPLRRVDLQFDTSYEAGTEQVKAALYDAISGNPLIVLDPAPEILLSAFRASAIEYTLRVWVNSSDYWTVYFELNEAVRESFARNHIQMTYEHVNVHLVRDAVQE
jgi:small conductance mechanosensitive channel